MSDKNCIHPIRFIFRGETIVVDQLSPTRSLLDWLREDQRATGTKEGCNEGDCGACTVVLARVEEGRLVHKPVNACITFLGMVDGAEVLTIEDLKQGEKLHPIQHAMVTHHGSQCGFCTPGIVMSLFALGKEHDSQPTREQINDQLSGNLCRCTGYRPILDAAHFAFTKPEPDHLEQRAEARMAVLKAIDRDTRETGAFVRSDEGFFAAPRCLEDALQLLSDHPDTTIVAGATDVGLWITKQFRPISKVIWLGRISALQAIENKAGQLKIGAGVSHEAALPALEKISPDLAELGRRFGSKQVRAQGTIGGNIANGSPIGDWAPAFIALDAELTLAGIGPQGTIRHRNLPLESFFIAYGKQDRERTELVETLTVPHLKQDEHFRCYKISKRFDEDISALMGAFKLTAQNGRITAARIAFGGMAATPRRAPKAEAALINISLKNTVAWQAAIDALREDYQPIDDMRASATYRREVAGALLRRALSEIAGGDAPRLREMVSGETSHAS